MKIALVLQIALEQLADRIDVDPLLASTDPVAFVKMVIDRIDSLEATINRKK